MGNRLKTGSIRSDCPLFSIADVQIQEIYGFADKRLAGCKSQEISNGREATSVKQAVEIPLVDFLHELVGQAEGIDQFSKQFHFCRVFFIVSRNYA